MGTWRAAGRYFQQARPCCHSLMSHESCATALPGSTRHRDRSVVVFSHADDINVQDAIKVVRSMREAPRRSR